MASIDKDRSRRNRARVRELFWREWDPGGVNDAPETAYQYDSYAKRTYVTLMGDDCSASELAEPKRGKS